LKLKQLLKWFCAALLTVCSMSTLAQSHRFTLDPKRGSEDGAIYQAWLSPQQEGGEERDTPKLVPEKFRSTAASVDREDRMSRGHGLLRFSKDYSRAFVDIKIDGVDPATITMFHIHCGKPGVLGPILVDFGLKNNLNTAFSAGVFSAEVRNEDLVAVSKHSHTGIVAFATMGCPIAQLNPAELLKPFDRVKTIAGMAAIAREGELYFNLHTAGQQYFGDIRGQLEAVNNPHR
jgi:hypothetical protein